MRIIHVFRRRYWGVILGLLVAALVRGSAGAQTSVKFTLDWKFEGPAALPFWSPWTGAISPQKISK